MKTRLILALFLSINTVSVFSLEPATSPQRTLDFYFIDTEGGGGALIVTPSKESVLIDAGWADVNGRDAKRIQLAMQQAGITAIDHMVATHYHQDHYGGIADLARLVTVKHFYDHGKMASMTEDPKFAIRGVPGGRQEPDHHAKTGRHHPTQNGSRHTTAKAFMCCREQPGD